MQIRGSTVLVAGGSSGLGAACAMRLIGCGARVIVADLQPPRDTALSDCASVLFVKTDVTKEHDVAMAIQDGEDRFGAIGGLVTSAGILKAERLLAGAGATALENFRTVIDVNLVGTFNVLRQAAAAIARRLPDADGERGVMITTASVAAFEGQIGQASYAASKGGVASMTLPLARELGGQGIRVVSIAPGVFETPMMEAASDKMRQSLLDQSPFPKRFGRPEEFASLVQHVFENVMLNGCVLRLDGGIRMSAR